MKEYVEKHKRNTFDLSFSNNLTFNFGQLVPCFCKEVIPGDSFKITPSFGLRLMPMVFPVQTKLQANLHFFYVRNRNLWKDWEDFIGRTKSGLVAPYIDNSDMFATGKLADYLGCPTQVVGDYGNYEISTTGNALVGDSAYSDTYHCLFPQTSSPAFTSQPYSWIYSSRSTTTYSLLTLQQILVNSQSLVDSIVDGYFPDNDRARARLVVSREFDCSKLPDATYSINIRVNQANFMRDTYQIFLMVPSGDDWIPRYCLYASDGQTGGQGLWSFTQNPLRYLVSDQETLISLNGTPKDWKVNDCLLKTNFGAYASTAIMSFDEFLEHLQREHGSTRCRLVFASLNSYSSEDIDESYRSVGSASGRQLAFGQFSTGQVVEISIAQTAAAGSRDVSEMGGRNPYASDDLHISALPFRAYESIYNAFYRNQFNDPFMLDGQKEYNKFIRNDEGGADSYTYDLFNRNYELDFLTSAKQSPVDGDITPLVGVSGSGDFTFQNSDGSTFKVKPVLGDDGHTLTGIDAIEGTPENNSGVRRLMDMISVGISINDFRNVNSLQRWLETNLRRGYRYKDQIMSHFGVEASYEELDMPEFIGGMSQPVLINRIDQTVDQTGDPSGLGDFAKVLGSFAGQGSVFAQANHSISKFCDEHGFIIGILSVTPTPSYSQLLPKMFLKDNVLDYYFPEFGHIGNQPITYKEVCPLQAYAAGDSLTDAFGYQRAWYDYIASVDENHGDFRSTLDGFLITRVFNSKPELGKDFIECRADTMSNPFSVTDETDKILGQVYFDVSAQRPIPKFGIPRLE